MQVKTLKNIILIVGRNIRHGYSANNGISEIYRAILQDKNIVEEMIDLNPEETPEYKMAERLYYQLLKKEYTKTVIYHNVYLKTNKLKEA